MSAVAIITARGGSKRIPKKNIKNFCGKPIIAYSIEAALKSELFDEVMVSTDSEEIAEVARQYGAKVPFMRSEKNSDDYATTVDVLSEVVSKYQEEGSEFDIICCIYPTAPFLTDMILIEAFKTLMSSDADSLMPVVKYSFPPQRAVIVRDGKLEYQYPQHMNSRSQDLEPIYHDCGMFYICKTSYFINNKKIFSDSTVPYIMREELVQDIDTLSDWKIAESKYRSYYDL
ncbi:N-Acetylneuraminate cytidylyltransferase [Anaerovibrio sp. JC8]|uniref:pseudaminic acid cytidylyltransferase n=1 Tax=Anaerovibrio sp. JC8 TaxID=1240085 RepID=UPI000A0B70DA|nr:pseudaminic acid cytidylyltransferase [Anaerovibrio sp. JC8]ORU01432.1 N-Acetylneuraminate cytidylyltransferase [Anaerovibrio sp. JC8]